MKKHVFKPLSILMAVLIIFMTAVAPVGVSADISSYIMLSDQVGSTFPFFSLYSGETLTFMYAYTDGTPFPNSNSITWSVSDTTIMTVSNQRVENGIAYVDVTALKSGCIELSNNFSSVTITASNEYENIYSGRFNKDVTVYHSAPEKASESGLFVQKDSVLNVFGIVGDYYLVKYDKVFESTNMYYAKIKDCELLPYSIELDNSSLTMKDGDTKVLTATITPDFAKNKSITWSSSDQTIATVDTAGKVTALKKGTATITATSQAYSVVFAEAEITVKSNISNTFAISIPDQKYTSQELKPSITVKDGEKTLVEDTDYTLEYFDNTNVGTATVKVTGIGDYSGEKTIHFEIVENDVSSAFAISSIPDQTYTGYSIEPQIEIKCNGKILEQGVNYSVSFKNNINVGTATAEISGLSGFAGAVTAYFEINPKSSSELVASSIPDQIYTSRAIQPEIVVTDNGNTVDKSQYTLSFINNVKVGQASVIVTFKNNYTGKITESFNIIQNTLFTIDDIPDQIYNPSGNYPNVTVKYYDYVLIKGKDYIVNYKNTNNVGTASVEIIGINGFSGIKLKQFEIKPLNAETNNIVISDIPEQPYTGHEIEPQLTISYNGLIIDDSQYTVTYKDNILYGKATAEVVFKNNYTGTKIKYFNIIINNHFDVEDITSQTYTGKEIRPDVLVTSGNFVLTQGKDYVVAYYDNIFTGIATAEIIGINGFTGSVTKTFIIKECEVNKSNISISCGGPYTYTGKEIKPEVKIKVNGKTVPKREYTVTYTNNIKIGQANVNVKFTKNYSGTAVTTFVITPNKINFKKSETEVSSDSIYLEWDSIANNVNTSSCTYYYEIVRNDEKGQKETFSFSSTQYIDNEVDFCSKYNYTICCVVVIGNNSYRSPISTVYALYTLPPEIAMADVNPTNSSLTASWTMDRQNELFDNGIQIYFDISYSYNKKTYTSYQVAYKNYTFIQSGLKEGVQVFYKISPYYIASDNTKVYADSYITCGYTLMSTPKDFAFSTDKNNNLIFSWEPVSNATGYWITQYDSNGNGTGTTIVVKGQNASSYTIPAGTIEPGKNYTYSIMSFVDHSAMGGVYSASTPSMPKTVSVDFKKPVITEAFAAVNYTSFKIKYDKISSDGYRIEVSYSTSKNGKYTVLGTYIPEFCAAGIVHHNNIKSGQTYYYKARAKWINAEECYSNYSDECAITTIKLVAPTNLNVTSTTSTTISLSWLGNNQFYKVYRYDWINQKYAHIATTQEKTYTDNKVKLNVGAAYLYKVSSAFGIYESDKSSTVCGITKITGVSSKVDGNSVTISFNADGNTNHDVRYKKGSGSWQSEEIHSQKSVTLKSLSAGSYQYYIVAKRTYNGKEYSTISKTESFSIESKSGGSSSSSSGSGGSSGVIGTLINPTVISASPTSWDFFSNKTSYVFDKVEYSYNGTAADFHRFEAGLPPADFDIALRNAFKKKVDIGETISLSDGGTLAFKITYNEYNSSDGVTYVNISKIDYEIKDSPKFQYCRIVCGQLLFGFSNQRWEVGYMETSKTIFNVYEKLKWSPAVADNSLNIGGEIEVFSASNTSLGVAFSTHTVNSFEIL